MDSQAGICLASFCLTVAAVFIFKPWAAWAGLVDRPGGRKVHKGVIPLIGGLAIYASVLCAGLMFLEQVMFVRMFLIAGGLLVFMGVLDDRYDLSARFRLVAQFMICSIFVYGLDVRVDSLGNILGVGDVQLGWLSYPFTIIALMSTINAFNMMDGIDGLVGGVSLIIFAGLAVLFAASGDVNMALICLSFVGAISAFLIFNLTGKPDKKVVKVFMGDAGSMFLGLSIGVLIVYGSQSGTASFSPTTALWLVLFPVTDMLTIMYRRIKRGRSPMSADRTHIHHILLRAGFNSKATLAIVMLVQLCLVAGGVVFLNYELPEFLSFLALGGLFFLYQLLMKRSWKFIRWSKRRLA